MTSCGFFSCHRINVIPSIMSESIMIAVKTTPADRMKVPTLVLVPNVTRSKAAS